MKGLITVIISNEHVKNGLAWAGKRLHAPEQRIVLGATALATQPFIDLHNKDVDEETRKLSAARTVAKIIYGLLTNILSLKKFMQMRKKLLLKKLFLMLKKVS